MRRGSRLTATDIKDAGSKLGSTDGSDARGESAPADQRGWVGCGYNGGQWLVWGVKYRNPERLARVCSGGGGVGYGERGR